MSVYAGLKPADALKKWYQLHHTPADQVGTLSPEEQKEAQAQGGMVTLAKENPAAWQLVKTGTPAVNDKRQVFNPMTGEFDSQDVHGLYSHWETWAQIIGGGILGGVAAAPYLAGTAGTGTAAGGVDAATVGAGTGVGVEGAGAGLAAVEGGGYGLGEAGLAGLGGATAVDAGAAVAPALVGPTAAGATTAGLGPSTAANMAATSSVVGGETVPTSLAATGGGGLGAGWLNTPLGLGLLGEGIRAGTSIYGVNAQTSAAEKAALLNSQSAADQLAFLKEKDAADRLAAAAHDAEAKREWDTTLGLNLAQWNRRQEQLEPYRQKSLAAGQELSRRLGLPAPTGGWAVPNPPVTLDDAARYGGGTPPIAVTPTPTDPSLSDPNKWMSLVGDDAQLTDFVTKGLGTAASVPGLVDYYKGKVKGQPGANATEQAGSAAYWNEKFANDPHRTTGSTTLAAVAPPALTKAPFQPSASSLAAYTPVIIPPTQSTTTLADIYGRMGLAV